LQRPGTAALRRHRPHGIPNKVPVGDRHGIIVEPQSRQNQTPSGRHIWWGEATDEPALARQSVATTAREDHRRAGQAARPTKFKMMSLLNGAWDLFIPIFYKYASPDGL